MDITKLNESYWLLLSFLILTLGYINNILSSAIEHKLPCHEPKASKLPRNARTWHEVKDALDKNDKIEGYFTRYAQARNMCGAIILSLIIFIFTDLISRSMIHIILIADLWICHTLIIHTLPHQRKRYYQVIKAEYEKQMKNLINKNE